MEIRKIIQSDNSEIAQVIRSVMTSYECVGEGYSIEDPEVSAMYEAYNNDKSIYYVVTANNKVIGGAGIGPLVGGAEDTCELKKMYFYPEVRGQGIGSQMLELLLSEAKRLGYKNCYLETVERMVAANKLYAKYGFRKLTCRLGGTGHGGCDTYYQLTL